MSLRVWLPLTKDLRNQGLDDVTVTNNGATFNSAGKLGGCYYFNGSSTIIFPSYDTTRSIAFWIKASKTNSTIAFVDYKSKLGFGFQSNGYIIPNCADSSLKMYAADNFVANEWNHIVVMRDDNFTDVTLYINGTLQTSRINSNNNWTNSVDNCYIGGRSTGTNMTCYMNDFRVYDHCLSPMEVKELAKGLVLHYPLNRQGWGQENLFNWSNNATGITLNDYQNKGSFTQFTNSLTFDPSTTVGKKYTISFWAKSPNGTTSLLLYNANSNPKYFYFSTTLTSSLGTEWQFFKYTVTNTQYSGSGTANTNTSIWKRIEIYAPNQMKVQVKQIKVEEGEVATPWCPNSSDALATTMGLNSTTEYDCSGFCNNLNKNGTYSYTSDTPKYVVSTKFNGTEWMNGTTPGAEILTLACWAKTSKNKSTSQFMVADSTSQLCIAFYSGTIISFFGSSGQSTGSKCTLGSAYKENDWNHFVVVKTGTGTRTVYCNGEPLTATSNDYWSAAGGLFIGSRNNSATLPFYGQICDVRAYATALSADDVKSLYQNSAYIDSSGNVYGAVHSEV